MTLFLSSDRVSSPILLLQFTEVPTQTRLQWRVNGDTIAENSRQWHNNHRRSNQSQKTKLTVHRYWDQTPMSCHSVPGAGNLTNVDLTRRDGGRIGIHSLHETPNTRYIISIISVTLLPCLDRRPDSADSSFPSKSFEGLGESLLT